MQHIKKKAEPIAAQTPTDPPEGKLITTNVVVPWDPIYEAFQSVDEGIVDALQALKSPISATLRYYRVEPYSKEDRADGAKRPKIFAVFILREDMPCWREGDEIIRKFLESGFWWKYTASDSILLPLWAWSPGDLWWK